ncbi:glycosyltransferase family 4 protein [Streptomyces sp. NPDC058319]|uniref:glycosyltransferase family 4 protein n=1 Tax=unclassified Streptomyces TaxID=2593676 RepID=UPI0036EB535D
MDMIHVEGYYMMQYLPDDCPVPVVLVEENVEYLLDKASENLGISDETECSWQRTAQIERNAWDRAQLCAAVSNDDLYHMRTIRPDLDLRWSPDGADHLVRLEPDSWRLVDDCSEDSLTVSFVGNFTYPPSEDAAVYLLEEVWPIVCAAVPQANLVIAGIGPSQRMRDTSAKLPRVELTGMVDSIAEVLDNSHVFVAPLRVGGGVKVKVLEAVVRGCPILTTPVGIQGLPSAVREAIDVQPQAKIADALVDLLCDRTRRLQMSTSMRSAADLLPSWDDAARFLWEIWTDVCLGSRRIQSEGPSR